MTLARTQAGAPRSSQSLKRWAGRETFGQTVAKFVDDWGVADDRTLRIRLTRPVPIFLEAKFLGADRSAVDGVGVYVGVRF